jgi:uncharacterized membrane protein
MGKSTISMAIFNSKLLVYQRVSPISWGSWVGTGKVLDRFLLDVRGYSLEAMIQRCLGRVFFLHLGAIVLEANVFVWAIQNHAGGL